MRKQILRVVTAVFIVLLSGCQGAAAVETNVPTKQAAATAETPAAVSTPTPKPSPTVSEKGSTKPQEIQFQASDGQQLKGRYYPAAVEPAPVVVLMHWVNGDMTDWNEIAPWLQNRGLKNPYPNCTGRQMAQGKWWDPTWFPEIPQDTSYGVFVFTFRDHAPCAGANAFNESGWLLDAQAAMRKASELAGVDPTRIAAVGSSIGADGAADACFWINEQKPGTCKGALSLSPGGFLGISYADAVGKLGKEQPPVAAWCLADSSEIGFCNMAKQAENPAFRAIEIANGHHGNLLLVPEAKPSTMQTILNFLAEVLK